MSEKALKTVLGIVAALVAAYAITYFVRTLAGGESSSALGDALQRVNVESVQEMRITGTTDTIVLSRDGASWKVNGHRADTASVGRLWSALSGTRVGDVVAENPTNHARLGVAADSAWTVEVRTAAGDTTRFLVGKAGPVYPSLYARMPDGDRVHLVTGDLRNVITRPLSDWRDKTIVRLDTAAVHQILIERDGKRYALQRADSTWSVDGEPADLAPVRDLLSELADLQAYGFPPDTAGFGDKPRTVLALGAGSDTLAHLTLASPDGINFRVSAAGNPTLYELSSWRADRLAPAKETVKARKEGGG
ncbi:MAG: DUF4340 domain-containing protein [Gemmatimonadetes bacterium]|nr:DUF4340 domain-containing protein [Gemmatimonadota bacterium]